MISLSEPPAGKGSDPIYQLKVGLLGSKPPIWRRLQVPGNASLGWTNRHLLHFLTAASFAPVLGLVFLLAGPMTATAQSAPLGPGDHTRTLMMGDQQRTYLVHVPKSYDFKKPTPVILALHGAAMNASLMAEFCGLNETSDKEGFIVVYPNGTGAGVFLIWNAGGLQGVLAEGRADDVAFINKLLDDLATVVKVDAQRVYACGMSNDGMMCYRLAAELSKRFAAIAPVAGTIAIRESKPKQPVSVIHFHGTEDNLVPFVRDENNVQSFMRFKGVEDSVQTWVKLNGCRTQSKTDILSKAGDELKVTRQTYGGGKNGSEVVLITIEGGGHTWPGMESMVGFLGKSALNISANDLMWQFFKKHKLK
jgi:polyhydroxybutyrate depolymerase